MIGNVRHGVHHRRRFGTFRIGFTPPDRRLVRPWSWFDVPNEGVPDWIFAKLTQPEPTHIARMFRRIGMGYGLGGVFCIVSGFTTGELRGFFFGVPYFGWVHSGSSRSDSSVMR